MKRIGIACVNHMNAIGYKNNLIYSIPNELKIFKKITSQVVSEKRPNVIVMGKNTFISMKSKPLPNRFNCVVTSRADEFNKENKKENLQFFKSIQDVLDFGFDNHYKYNNMFICGGQSIYEYFIDNNLLDYLIISQVTNHEFKKGDTFFPETPKNFNRISYCKHFNQPARIIDTNEKFNCDFTYKVYHNLSASESNEYYNDNFKKLTGYEDTTINNTISESTFHNEYVYLNALKDVLENGQIRQTRNSKTISTFGVNMKFDVSKSFPLLTTKNVYWNGVIKELLWFINANTNSLSLSKDKVRIWDGNSSREFLDSIGLENYKIGECGPIYGFQWRHFNAEYKGTDADYSGKGVDQLQKIIDLINSDPTSRRMIMSAWNPCQLSEMCLPPCHVLYQFYVRIDSEGTKHLSCQMYQRSGDMFLGIPFNIASTTALTYILCHMTNCKPDRVILNIGDAHVYSEHINAVKKQLERTPLEQPKLKILGLPKSNIKDYEIGNFVIENYRNQGTIKAPMIA